MRVLYGVVGEGMGHATRSRVVIEHLLARAQDVRVVASGRAFGYLRKAFEHQDGPGRAQVSEIRGLRLRYEDGALDRTGTLTDNVLAAPGLLHENYKTWARTLGDYRPDLVISDFDSFAYLFGRKHDVPVVSLDNIQFLARCKHPDFIKRGAKLDYQLTRAFVRAKLPKCARYIVTTFATAKVRHKCEGDTQLIPPILRAQVIASAKHAHVGEHVLVYQTSASGAGDDLLHALSAQRDHRFVVYGWNRDEQQGNLTLKSFRDQEFVTDLASARAVIANGGYTLLSEAVYLHKPVYTMPVRHQFEQELNARYIEHLGYGLAARDVRRLSEFFSRRREFAREVGAHEQDGNALLHRAIDATLGRIALGREGRRDALQGLPESLHA